MTKKIKKIGILCYYDFPEGMAATNRIISYGSGLVSNGVKVEVFIYSRKLDTDPSPLMGSVAGLDYYYAYRRKANASFFHKLLVDKPSMVFSYFRQIFESNKRERFDYLFLSTDYISFYALTIPILKTKGIKLAFIGDEFPIPIRQLKSRVPVWRLLLYKILYRGIDCRILMTNALANFYNTEVCEKPSFIMCSVLDMKRFEGIQKQTVERPYLCYMGNMMLAKDNVDNIIEAFSLIEKEYPEIDLYLYGNPSETDRLIVENKILELGLQKRAIIKGRVDYNIVPQVLANAKILVTSQPITKRAEGGFPTKMAEYMMSRVPMLVTDVGEISQYVQDGIDTFMVAPCDPISYADKLRYILSNPSVVEKVVANAYEKAVQNYGAPQVTKQLITFLSNN